MRIVAFVGSPVKAQEKEVIKIAKRLKKENVNLDIINFGETVSYFLCCISLLLFIDIISGSLFYLMIIYIYIYNL